MSKLDYFCSYTPLKVFGFSLTISIVITLFMAIFQPFRSEGDIFSDEILGFFFIGASLFNSLISYTICFNLYKTVRNNPILSFLSFYAPLFIVPLASSLILSKDMINSYFGENLLFWLFVSLPFIIPQTYYFVKFRIRLRKGEITDDFYYISDNENN